MGALFFASGKTATLIGASLRMELQNRARVARFDFFLVIGIHQKRQRRAVGAGRRLDDVRHDVFVGRSDRNN